MTDTDNAPIRVVIVDDHALVREGTKELLTKHEDIEVVGTAADGLAALELITTAVPDVALVDIAMPGLSGIEVTERVKASHPEVAVLILTVHDEMGYVRALISAGAAGYLLKDIGGTELVRSVRAVHAGESVLHPTIRRVVFESLVEDDQDESNEWDDLLTDREMDVLKAAAQGQSNKQIAGDLEVSPRTVQAHLANTFEKLGVASRTEAVIQGLRKGLLDLDELG
jgi:two-component system, NarL family, response regulator LiaR